MESPATRLFALFLFFLLVAAPALQASDDTRAQSKLSLQACIDRDLAERESLKDATVDDVLLVCGQEYSAFMASLDEERVAIYPRLVRGYVALGLQDTSP